MEGRGQGRLLWADSGRSSVGPGIRGEKRLLSAAGRPKIANAL